MPTELLQIGVPTQILAASPSGTTGVGFATPKRCPRFAWATSITGGPAAINTVLEGSFDNTNWSSIDTATNVAGEVRQLISNAMPFIRVRNVSITGGAAPTVAVTIELKDSL